MASPAAQINVLGSSRGSSIKTPDFTTPKTLFLGQRLGQTTPSNGFIFISRRFDGVRRVGPLRIVNEKVEVVDLGTTNNSAVVAFEVCFCFYCDFCIWGLFAYLSFGDGFLNPFRCWQIVRVEIKVNNEESNSLLLF